MQATVEKFQAAFELIPDLLKGGIKSALSSGHLVKVPLKTVKSYFP